MNGRESASAPLRALSRLRRPLGALCAALALTGAVLLLRPPPTPATEVLVAARRLDALAPLAPGDLAVRALSPAAVPEHALRPRDDPLGRSLTGPVTRGEVLTRARIAGPPAGGYGPGLVAAPVRPAGTLPDGLVRPGSRVDVLAAPGGDAALHRGEAPSARTVVEDRPVIAVEEPGAADAASAGPLLVLAVRPAEARALAGHAGVSRMSVTLRG
ncbi:RcpC/CpaB family pilus assembly protein [Streptomonospora wellingtoniae]|uniref:RcpC/CpaB family pilus assembly protein n=1 Tax=Streptomonospora wellingtoniae TaxID=3075544 RepID=A0ABU2KV75_9ACTN|nr:RcpC/CpaB family pilus assembly protein [Streptomonospora sp. DSM 45055]MDT0303162.1 RcpC/CpaB family pilus assembly protein [Streptomonospora sp. DSM 45055]